MTTVAGIEIEKNAKGQDVFIRIDLKKYGKKLQPFLQEIGVVEDVFEEEWQNALTIEEAKEKSLKKIREWWKK